MCHLFLDLNVWAQYQLYRHKGTVFFKCVPSSFLASSSNPSPSPLPLPATWNVRSPASVVPPGLRHLNFLILPSTKHRLWEKSTPSSCLLDGRTNALYEFLPRTSQGCRLMHKPLTRLMSCFFRWPWIHSNHGKPLHFPEDFEEFSL